MKKKLWQKLGIQENRRSLAINPPDGYFELLDLPFSIKWDQVATVDTYDFIHIFVRDFDELERCYRIAKTRLTFDGMLWISWYKRSAGKNSTLSSAIIREYGLANGLVDVKVASVDEQWSALKFVYRLKDRP